MGWWTLAPGISLGHFFPRKINFPGNFSPERSHIIHSTEKSPGTFPPWKIRPKLDASRVSQPMGCLSTYSAYFIFVYVGVLQSYINSLVTSFDAFRSVVNFNRPTFLICFSKKWQYPNVLIRDWFLSSFCFIFCIIILLLYIFLYFFHIWPYFFCFQRQFGLWLRDLIVVVVLLLRLPFP